ncbi:MAG: ornithine cyclodeaminase family protein [Thermoanaerobaculia bacterium]
MSTGTLLLTRADVAGLLDLEACIDAVEDAFRRHAEGDGPGPGSLGLASARGAFHVKAAGLRLSRPWFTAKLNANFPDNPVRLGQPPIRGLIVLCDAETGYPVAVMDSIEITIQRTGAATAVAARRLARPDSRVATICGCGNQGAIQLRALANVLPLERAFAFDRDAGEARRFAVEQSARLVIAVEAVRDLAGAVRESDAVVTCTPSREFFLERRMVCPGTFIAAVGADNPDKQELEPEHLAAGKVVADVRDQCAAMGELHRARGRSPLARGRARRAGGPRHGTQARKDGAG